MRAHQRRKKIMQDDRPKCRYCNDPLAGGPGTWYSTLDQTESCRAAPRQRAPVPFHEPPEEADVVSAGG